MEYQIGRHFAMVGKPITALYLGDHDPSGHSIEADMHSRVQDASGVKFEMRRLAIHPGDIVAFGLPPQLIKNSDSRASSFRKKFGVYAPTVELDSAAG